ncbi:VRR-NUC domain-containing protein [Cantharellus anzutake]|uniref:VRR-NUC domain-containing protein n=1 Tax=Cantharellus anzutake TaxID=1750568 RepID=UPI0019050E40|nr:VRR-NUC domain-containing protein [Cantharellus anzutake]KAF8337884.1 VRR-NUC domain-containing protein [Cantharellus anzutake]
MQPVDTIPFASADSSEDEEDVGLEKEPSDALKRPQSYRSESMYTKLLQQLIETVLEYESHLFSSEELDVLERLNNLTYHSRYLLVRLLLRSRCKLHRLSDLEERYSSEIKIAVSSCIDELCRYVAPAGAAVLEDSSTLSTDPEVLAPNSSRGIDGIDGQLDTPGAGPCPSIDRPSHFLAFAEDESALSTEELLNSLKLDELKLIGSTMKITKLSTSRRPLIASILQHASRQTTLPSFYTRAPKESLPSPPASTEPPTTPERPRIIIDLITPPPSSGSEKSLIISQKSRLRDMILEVEKRFIRISEHIFKLFERFNLVYFRCTEMSSNSLLLPLILSKSRRRHYPPCDAKRTPNIFRNRDALLNYEEALRLEEEMDNILGHPLLEGEKPVTRVLQAKALYDSLHGKWQQLCKDQNESAQGPFALERFEEGHVLTRIMYKGADALAKLHMYAEEAALLTELLSQKRWRRGKRGLWYDRLALVYMKHQSEPRKALQVVVNGLQDPLYRPQLERRLARLEKMLKIPNTERHECLGKQRKANARRVCGKRIHVNDDSNPLAPGQNTLLSVLVQRRASRTPLGRPEKTNIIGTHSLWVGKNGSTVRVEQLALEHYETLGYRGYHSEGRIIYHMFLLLFWSIVFQPIPGAFETLFQRGPLDLGFDSFYHARRDEIEQRLQDIENGEGPRIVAEVDDRERPMRAFGVGAKWDAFTKEDVVDAAMCIGGTALSVICRVICEDYSHRSSGVPDLLVWNISSQKALFVEVKGPGDTLMENQKVWIDVLMQAGASVEVCHVEEEGMDYRPSKSTAKASTGHTTKPNAKITGSDDPAKCAATALVGKNGAPLVTTCGSTDVIFVHDSDSEVESALTFPRKRFISESAKGHLVPPDQSTASSKKPRLSSVS